MHPAKNKSEDNCSLGKGRRASPVAEYDQCKHRREKEEEEAHLLHDLVSLSAQVRDVVLMQYVVVYRYLVPKKDHVREVGE